MQLTDSQKQAVEQNEGPLLIIAGAGTGKTTVLIEKIKFLIQNKLAKPEEILALTFTDKACREIEERVDRALPLGYNQLNIATFHSFSDSILRDEAAQIGLSPAYKLQTAAQQVYFLRKHLFELELNYFRPLGNPTKFLEGLLQHFSRLRDEDITPEDYLKWTESDVIPAKAGIYLNRSPIKSGMTKNEVPKQVRDDIIEEDSGQARVTEIEKYSELARAYKKFQELKIRENVMDFADLIFYAVRLFKKRPNVTQQYRSKFKYILVDEFQDTNIAQYELIKLLAPPQDKPNLAVIGDDNQSIYKFRGASVSNILKFMEDYPSAEKVILLENFRSNQKILDAAYKLIKNNDPDTLEARLNISKNLKSTRGDGSKDCITFHIEDRVENEADFVAKEILRLKKNYEWRDFAILIRANNHADSFVRAFSRAGIPYQFLGPATLFKQPEVKDLIAYLNVLYDINDSPSFYRVLAMDCFDINRLDLANLLSFTRKTSLSLFEACEAYLSFFNLEEFSRDDFNNYHKHLFISQKETKEKLLQIIQIIKRALERVKTDTAGQILYYFLEDSGLLQKMMNYKTEKEERASINISKFFDRLKSFEIEQEDASVFAVVDYISMSMELGESPLAQNTDWSEFDAVNILTAHSSKGLEFPVVFLVNLTTDRFPTKARNEQIPIPTELIKEILPEGNFHLEEERRLFYVGMTRAKDFLYMTVSNFYGEGKRERKISPFVFETINEKDLLKAQNTKKDEKQQLSIFDFKLIEAPVAKEKVNLTNFSYSQIDTYSTCPLRYKYQYILKVPTTANSAASFGDSIHQALHQFYSGVKSGEDDSLESLLAFFKKLWVPLGYKSKIHEERMKIEGQTFLKNFYETFFSKHTTVLDLEKWFRIKVDNELFVTGKIDRVDTNSDGKIEIIDYKTGKVPKDEDLKKNLQLSMYAFAASDPTLYKKPVTDIVLTFYFLSENKKISLQKTDEDLVKVKEKVTEIVNSIKEGSFEPKVGPWCSYCPFKINCEAWQ